MAQSSLSETATHCNTLQHIYNPYLIVKPVLVSADMYLLVSLNRARLPIFARLQCVAVCCSVLQCVAVCCSVLQCVAVCCSVLQCVYLSKHE